MPIYFMSKSFKLAWLPSDICVTYLLRIGTLSDVLGSLSSTTVRNTENDKRTVIPSETFSPDSGGSQNTNRSITDRRMIGIKTFMMVYRAFLSSSIENWKKAFQIFVVIYWMKTNYVSRLIIDSIKTSLLDEIWANSEYVYKFHKIFPKCAWHF